MWARYILLVGILAALTLSVVVTVPYVLAWNSFSAASREMNVVALKGTTYSGYLATTLANISLVAVYPRASVYATENAFRLQLVFFVNLDPQITLFGVVGQDIWFLPSVSGNPSFFGSLPINHSSTLEWGYSLDRSSDHGHIAPFYVNYSIPISSGVSPPPFVSNLLYFTGSYQVHPEISLNAVVSTVSNVSANIMGFGFIMKDYLVTICCFNYPPTLWAAYASSIIIAASVSLNYRSSRKRIVKQSELPPRSPKEPPADDPTGFYDPNVKIELIQTVSARAVCVL